MVTRLEEMENWLIGKEPPRWQLILRDTVYGIDYDAKVDIDALLAVAEAAVAFIRAEQATGGMTSAAGGVTEEFQALEAAVAPLLIEVTE